MTAYKRMWPRLLLEYATPIQQKVHQLKVKMKIMHPCKEGHWGHRLEKRGGHSFGKCLKKIGSFGRGGHHHGGGHQGSLHHGGHKFGGPHHGGHKCGDSHHGGHKFGRPHHGGHKFDGPHHGGHGCEDLHHGGHRFGGHKHGGPHHGGPHHFIQMIRFGPHGEGAQTEMVHKFRKHFGLHGPHHGGPHHGRPHHGGPHHGPPCRGQGPRSSPCCPPSPSHHDHIPYHVYFEEDDEDCHCHHDGRGKSLSPGRRGGPRRSRSCTPRCGSRTKSPKTTAPTAGQSECQTDVSEPTCDHNDVSEPTCDHSDQPQE
ncbi:hypothetical protein GE061_016522 [Apolygus lucorum]|uniref:Uncharacterized protein n=1 Tax=Apolygus lucorum TaxID=248454 RepID=A0A8S9XGH0_APOLU|nr:hypothetical protein GE061_016522 [Apolygus lucorum]